MTASSPWERRLQRAVELRGRWPWAREVLDFFAAITKFQQEVAARLSASPSVEPNLLVVYVPQLLQLVERDGPSQLAGSATRWRALPDEARESALRSFWRAEGGREATERFFPKVLLQPYAMALARGPREEERAPRSSETAAACPFCGHAPASSVLREDRTAGALMRSLVCSLCAQEWSFGRVACPACREERPEKLPRYTAEEIPWLRVDACDACGLYLKALDMTKEPGAEPVADEIASIPLDVLARERGYTKIEPNLAGI